MGDVASKFYVILMRIGRAGGVGRGEIKREGQADISLNKE
jgi:hypothetical protein